METGTLRLKKIAMVVFILGSSAGFASSMGPAYTEGNVTVPSVYPLWTFSAQALYLQPNYSGIDFYGVIEDANFSAVDFQKVNDKQAWGFKLEGTYHFYTGNDLNLNWSQNLFKISNNHVTWSAY